MDGYKVGSARIYQLFSNASGGASTNSDSSKKTEVQKTQTPVVQNTDAVRVSATAQQEQATKASRIEELKRQVQSGEYQKQIKNPASVLQIAKKVVEFYSA